MDFEQAVAAGARTMIVGVANAGGVMGEETVAHVVAALRAGLNVASGLHERLRAHPEIVIAAERHGRTLFDAREPPATPVGKGLPRAGKRLLAVGTDCSVGKMYTTLAIERELRARGVPADFRATGQTGIFIAGRGMPLDAVVADFISGGVEWPTPGRDDGGWDLMVDSILLRESDLGLTLQHIYHPGIERQRLASGAMVAIAPPGWWSPEELARPLSLGRLSGQPLIGIAVRDGLGRSLQAHAQYLDPAPDIGIWVQTCPLARTPVADGHGMAVVDRFTAWGNGDDAVQIRPLEPVLEVGLSLIHRKGSGRMSPVQKAFVDCLSRSARTMLALQGQR